MISLVEPLTDLAAARRLGDALRSVGYTEDAVAELLDDEDAENPTVGERRLPRTPLGAAVRLFFLQLPVSRREAVRALGKKAVDAFAAIGLAELGDDVVPRARIIPVRSLLVASDDFPADDAEQPAGYVAAYTPASRVCDCLTPRRRVNRALDVGTGSGVQALLAARHARRVVATDVNERALAYTKLNAALNALPNVECRQGSLFEPVRGERFDLITSNAPYVISPENRWIYRDAGFEGDELSERIVREAADHLADGGFATLLVSWIARDENEPDERPLAWTEATACDTWILPVWEADALGHAATWNDYLVDQPAALERALDTWTGYLERLGVRHVSEGVVLLHRGSGRRRTARVDVVDEDELDEAASQILRAFTARARLAELRPTTQLLDARLAVAAPLRVDYEVTPRRRSPTEVRLEIDEGTHSVVEASKSAIDIVTMLDGGRSLGEAVETAAAQLRLSDADRTRLRRAVLRLARELLELGALSFRDAGG